MTEYVYHALAFLFVYEIASLKGHYGKYLAWQIVLGFLLIQEQYI